MKTIFTLILVLFSVAVPARAVDPEVNEGETSLNLDIAFGIRFVPDSRVTVPVGETVRMNVASTSEFLQWYKNGIAIPGARERQYVLPTVQPRDAGVYTARDNNPLALVLPFTNINLAVGGLPSRLINSSTRATVSPGVGALVGGFVVAGPDYKKVIIRAVGPTLAMFNISNALAQPVLKIYDSEGKIYTEQYVYLPSVGALTYERDLRESLEKAGAFPIPPNTKDAVELRPFKAGAYTAHISGADGGGGAVLLEIYEVP